MVLDRSEKEIRAWVDGIEQTASEWSTHVPDGLIESSHGPLVLFDTEGQQEQGKDTPCALDDFRIYNQALSPAEVKALFSARGEIAAGAPRPANGAQDALAGTSLYWMPGKPAPAYQYDVYFGTDASALNKAGRQSEARFTPETKPDTPYFWRVDEVTATGKMVPGRVWQFHTGGRALRDPPLRNPGFEAGAIGRGIDGWHDSVGYTFTADEGSEGCPSTPDGSHWAELDRSRWIYQQIGHYTENRELEIRFLHGRKADKNAQAVVVGLYAGGNPASAGDQNLKIDKRNPLEAMGGKLVAESKAIAPPSGSGDAVDQRKVTLSSGTGHAVGEPLWLLIHTQDGRGRTLLDDIQVRDVTKR
jgi:hypothetical protein